MSRQATKLDLENILAELGTEFEGRPTVPELRERIHAKLRKLHSALAVLGYGPVGIGLYANRKRLDALHNAARAKQDRKDPP